MVDHDRTKRGKKMKKLFLSIVLAVLLIPAMVSAGVDIPDAVKDAMLAVISGSATTVWYCSGDPVNYAGIAAVNLGSKTITGANFSVGNGDTSGRKLTLGALTDVTATATGNITYVVVTDGSAIKAKTTHTSQGVISGQIFDSPAVDLLEILDATTP
jgi:hypothetical protein